MERSGTEEKTLKRLQAVLLSKKKEILRNVQRTLNQDMTVDADDLPDEMSLASRRFFRCL